MASGVRAEVRITSPKRCTLAEVAADASIRSVARTSVGGSEECVTEFVADDPVDGAQKVFDYDSASVYRLVEDTDQPCVCARLERMGYPVRDHRVEDGVVTLSFFVPDVAALQSAITDIAADGRNVTIRRLTRSGSSEGDELVYVDKRKLTDRQLEVLRSAHRMGYFEHPKEANAGEVAAELGISTATFSEHLSAAQRKLLAAILD